MFDRQGEITPPCGEPSVAWRRSPSSSTPAFSHLSIILRMTPSVTRLSRNARRWECEIDRHGDIRGRFRVSLKDWVREPVVRPPECAAVCVVQLGYCLRGQTT